jgi:hypothetical protein
MGWMLGVPVQNFTATRPGQGAGKGSDAVSANIALRRLVTDPSAPRALFCFPTMPRESQGGAGRGSGETFPP